MFLCLLCICMRLFVCALWSPVGKGLTSWLPFVVSDCKFVTFPLVFWVRSQGGTLIFSSYVGSGPASTIHPKKNIRNSKHPKKYLKF